MKLEFHHINFVSKDVDKMDKFYKKILNMKGIPLENFPRTEETDDIKTFLKILKREKIPFSDYGTTFAKEWHQVFFQDPEGNVVEVHQKIS